MVCAEFEVDDVAVFLLELFVVEPVVLLWEVEEVAWKVGSGSGQP